MIGRVLGHGVGGGGGGERKGCSSQTSAEEQVVQEQHDLKTMLQSCTV